MVRAFITSVLAITVFAAAARAERIYVGWQLERGGIYSGIIGAYDLATGNAIGPPPTFPALSDKPQGVAVSPLDGNIYVAIDRSGPIQSYNPVTGNVVNADFASLGNTVFGMSFDSAGNLYASLKSNKYIIKITSDGTIDLTWGSPASDAGTPNDIMIFGDKLYGAMPSSLGGAVVYDLSGANEGVGGWLTTGDVSYGIAFGSDNTMYTTNLLNRDVRAWSGPDYLSADSDIIGHLSGSGIQDIDYYDGCLYLRGDTSADGTGIYRYDLSASTPTWEMFIPAPAGYRRYIGYFDIVPDPIPEPGTMALLVSGLIGLLAYAWRRRK